MQTIMMAKKDSAENSSVFSTLNMFLIVMFGLCLFSSYAQAVDTLANIKAKQAINVAYRSENFPFSYAGDNKKPIGYSIDACSAVIEAIKNELKLPKLSVNYVEVTVDTRFTTVESGKADIECGSSNNSVTRNKQVEFAIPYFFTTVKMMVKMESPIKNWKDLNSKKVALTKGSSSIKLLSEHNETKGLKITVVETVDNQAAFDLLEKGQVDAFIKGDVILYSLRAEAKKVKQYNIVGNVLFTQTYAITMRKEDPQFKKMLDKHLANLMINGEMTKLYNKWFTKATPPKNINLEMPMNRLLLEHMRFPTDQHLE